MLAETTTSCDTKKDAEDSLRGWIQPCFNDPKTARTELERIGVTIGDYNPQEKEFQNCTVSLTTMNALDPLWGRYIWGLS